jgi:hypothetical protein
MHLIKTRNPRPRTLCTRRSAHQGTAASRFSDRASRNSGHVRASNLEMVVRWRRWFASTCGSQAKGAASIMSGGTSSTQRASHATGWIGERVAFVKEGGMNPSKMGNGGLRVGYVGPVVSISDHLLRNRRGGGGSACLRCLHTLL